MRALSVKTKLTLLFTISGVAACRQQVFMAGCRFTRLFASCGTYTESMQGSPENRGSGPSWGVMLLIIFAAMLVAIAIAWAFIHSFQRPH